jgi:hypothetical protein
MRDLNDVWNKIPPPTTSPCNNNCFISSQTGFCVGCFRSIPEIIEWDTADDATKSLILKNCEERNEI